MKEIKIKLNAYGIARDILHTDKTDLLLAKGSTIHHLKEELMNSFPEFKHLVSIKFAVNDEYQFDEFVLNDSDEVVLIPPVSGG